MEKEAKIDRQCVTYHSLYSQVPNSLKAKSMETSEKRNGTQANLVHFLIKFVLHS